MAGKRVGTMFLHGKAKVVTPTFQICFSSHIMIHARSIKDKTNSPWPTAGGYMPLPKELELVTHKTKLKLDKEVGGGDLTDLCTNVVSSTSTQFPNFTVQA